MTKLPYIYNDDGEPVYLPYVWEICGHCSGEGMSSAYLGAFTWDELNEKGEEFIEDYFAGNYDRGCDCCEGSGKIAVVNYDRLSDDQKKRWDEKCEAEWEIEAERRAEKRMGC